MWAGIAISTTLLGWGTGGLIGGTLADYIGRKQMMLYSVLLYGTFTGLTGLSTNFTAFAGLRFLTGLAMGSEWSTGVTLVAETWPDRARPKGCGFLQSGFGCGALFASVVWWMINGTNPLGFHSWRLMFAVGALPAAGHVTVSSSSLDNCLNVIGRGPYQILVIGPTVIMVDRMRLADVSREIRPEARIISIEHRGS